MKKHLIEMIFVVLILVTIAFGMGFMNGKTIEIRRDIKTLERLSAEQLEVPAQYFDRFAEVCEKYNVNSILMSQIIKCESGWDPSAKNPKSTATGLCQFLDGTWDWTLYKMGIKNGDRFDVNLQLEACAWLIANDDLGHWDETRKCWQDYNKNN